MEEKMNSDSKIREAQNRVIDVFKKRPKKALSTNYAIATIEDGFICNFKQGDHSAVMDMPQIMGGDDAGPTPGFFARAGIAGCVSMGIKQAAVMAGIAVDSVTVEIETDFDDGASMGLGESSAAPLETRLAIRINTSANESKVNTVVKNALSMDPWFLALRDAQSVNYELVIDGSA